MGALNGADLAQESEARKNTHEGDLLGHKPTSRKSREDTDAATIARLAATFPQCFAVYQLRRRPLKVGIHHDIIAKVEIDPRELRRALRLYVHNDGYLRGMRVGIPRIDLDGNPVGAVTAEQAKQAADELKRRKPTTGKQNGSATPRVSTTPRPPRITLSDLREAAARRRQAVTP